MRYKFKLQPYKHQLDALRASWNKHEYAWFMDMGTGKSKVLIDNFCVLYDRGKISGVLIIAPKVCIETGNKASYLHISLIMLTMK